MTDVRLVATAGHVDHGKSTLVRALTGTDPDRLAEERLRGMTIDLGYAWRRTRHGALVFVDVPGHERYVRNMLTGAAVAPSFLFVVAADEGWRAQSAEHLAILSALGVRDGVVAVTKTDRADPARATAEARERFARVGLPCDVVAVSARAGTGLNLLVDRLLELPVRTCASASAATARVWVDRGFTVPGWGTVVTGTVVDGVVTRGDRLRLDAGTDVRVRRLEVMKENQDSVTAVTRVALSLSGVATKEVGRGSALTGSRVGRTTAFDAALPEGTERLPSRIMTCIVGTAAPAARVRLLGRGVVRVVLTTPLPVRAGDRALLRDATSRAVVGVTILNPLAPDLRTAASRRRYPEDLRQVGAARALAKLAGAIHVDALDAVGIGLPSPIRPDDGWLVDDEWTRGICERLRSMLTGGPILSSVARQTLDLPRDVPWAALLATQQEIVERRGELVLAAADRERLAVLTAELARTRFGLVSRQFLADAGIHDHVVEQWVGDGALWRGADGVLLLPADVDEAWRRVRRLPQPFTVAAARDSLGTTRRVVLALLGQWEVSERTARTADGRHIVISDGGGERESNPPSRNAATPTLKVGGATRPLAPPSNQHVGQ